MLAEIIRFFDIMIVVMFFLYLGKDIFPVSMVGSLARNGSFWMIKVGESDLRIAQQIHSGLR